MLHLELCKSPSKVQEMVFQRLYSFKISPGTCPRTTHRISPAVTPFGGRYSVPPTFTTALTPLATFQATPITEQPIDIYIYDIYINRQSYLIQLNLNLINLSQSDRRKKQDSMSQLKSTSYL